MPDVTKIDSSVMIRSWLLKGSYPDTTINLLTGSKNQILNSKNEHPLHNVLKQPNPVNYYQYKDYILLDSVFKIDSHNITTNSQVNVDATCVIKSSIEQEVALLFGMHGSLKLWLNGELVRSEINHDNISKNRYTEKVHLKKGDNNILVKLSTESDTNISWTFHLDVAPINYVRKYAFGDSFFSIGEQYLFNERDSLSLRIKYPGFIPTSRPVQMQIINVNSDTIINKAIPPGNQWKIALNGLTTGAYKCRLITDLDTLQQCFVYGNYKKVFKDYQNQIKRFPLNDVALINTETLFNRFLYMDDFGARNQYGDWLERKISATIFEMGVIISNLSSKKDAFAGIPGLHVRGFKSTIDQSVDNYMVYVPQAYQPGKKIPLVMMMPYVTKQEPFLKSWHVADITRIELIIRLANRYGFGVLWPGARTYKDYNLNPIVSSATFEALAATKKDYNVDENRIYLYGDCSGGLQALLLANRFPSFFAAIGVEGPELSYIQSGYPNAWTHANDIIQTAENYKNIPILIFHTPVDKKADFSITNQLVTAIKSTNGHVYLDTLNNATKEYKFKLISEEVIISKIFEFYKNKEKHTPDTINFSTYQLKYNRSSWITINNKENNKKATVYAVCSKKNTIKINTTNVNNLTINLIDIPQINKKRSITIICNEKEFDATYPVGGRITLNLTAEEKSRLLKTEMVEGPINDVFKSGFIVVSGTSGTAEQNKSIKVATDTFCDNWKEDFFTNCERKEDVEISDSDLLNRNLILVGSEKTNLIINRFKKQIPLSVSHQFIEIKNKRYPGKALSYSLIYPNPANHKRYFLIIGANYNNLVWGNIKDFALQGWYDYEVWNPDSIVDAGYFNKYWTLDN